MIKTSKILYVEDDETLSVLTKEALESRGYAVRHCENGEIALNVFNTGSFDICILDIMLPLSDGFSVARKIRAVDPHIPILFLTAKSQHEDKIQGLKTGADDYITKPFSIEELVLKIEVFLRRNKITNEVHDSNRYSIGKFSFDYFNQEMSLGDKKIVLTHREAELIQYFARHSGQLIKRETLLKQIWGDDNFFLGRSLDVFISRLRKIFKDDPSVKIENIHGIGFRLRAGDRE